MSIPDGVLEFVRRGFLVIPTKGKVPVINDWPNKATNDKSTLELWTSIYVNFAVVTGKGNLVLDIDGPDGEHSIKQWEQQGKYLSYPTLTVDSSKGRYHLYYRFPPGIAIKNSAGELASGIDTRGDGGCAVIPPSLHASGNHYRFHDQTAAIANAPDWLVEAVRNLKAVKSNGHITEQDTTARVPESHCEERGIRCDASEREQIYAGAALENEINKLLEMGDGSGRNSALNTAAFNLGTLVGVGWILRSEVENALFETARKNGYIAKDGADAAWNTIQSGLDAGIRKPHGSLAPLTPATPPAALPAYIAPPPPPPPPPPPTQTLVSPSIVSPFPLRRIFDKTAPLEYIVPNFILCGGTTLFTGSWKSGKSTFMSRLAYDIASGQSFLGFPAQPPRPVLYFDYENWISLVQERFTRLKIFDVPGFEYWGLDIGEVPHPSASYILTAIEKMNPRPLVILDSYIASFKRMFPNGQENSAGDNRQWYNLLDPLKRLGCGIGVLDHTDRENQKDSRGSGDKHAAIDIGCKLTNAGGGIGLTDLTLRTFVTRVQPIELHFRYQDGLFINCESSQQIENSLTSLLLENKKMNAGDIEKHEWLRAFGRDKVRAALAGLVEDGTVLSKDGPRNSKLYSLAGRPNFEALEREWRQKMQFAEQA
jgi:Bifunctional DNA primase/polymerase, N-terminal/AAA domain